MSEAEAVMSLCPIGVGQFGYSLANGIVGVYSGEQRMWRIKVLCMWAPQSVGSTYGLLISRGGWKASRVTPSNDLLQVRFLSGSLCNMYRIDHCIAGCMTRYLPREKLFPAEAEEVPRAKPEVLPRLPREIIFAKVDNGSYTPLRSDLSILYYA